jgi:uncharacterized membrane protein required for colicin V production
MASLESMTAGDVLLAVLIGLFVAWGWHRGVPRRILSTLAVIVAIAIAAQIRNPVGFYLGSNWTDTPRAYGYMVAFSAVLTAFLAAIAWFVEWRMPQYVLFPRAPLLEKAAGAALALVQALILLGAAAMTLDPYFERDGRSAASGSEFLPYRGVSDILRGSLIMGYVRDDFVPALLGPVRGLFPRDLEESFPGGGASPSPDASPAAPVE